MISGLIGEYIPGKIGVFEKLGLHCCSYYGGATSTSALRQLLFHKGGFDTYKNPRPRTRIRETFVRISTCRVQIKGIGISARRMSVAMFVAGVPGQRPKSTDLLLGLPELKRPNLRSVFHDRHLAVPCPCGGGRSVKSHIA